jgi:TolB-like protein/Tfp pilus assembly protein PilF
MHHIPPSAHAQIAACLAGLDRMDEAHAEMKLYLSLARKHMPNFPTTEEQWRTYWFFAMPYKFDKNSEQLFELLLKAGLCDFADESLVADNPGVYPAIAVLPFNNLSGDPEQEYFSDGISETIILGLSMYKGLVTKSSYASFAYRESEKSIAEIAEELQVRYLVDGSVRKVGNRVRIAAQLIESGTGNQIWGKHYDAEPDDILDLERELSKTIVGNISSRIDHDIQQSVIRKPVSDLTSFDYFMRAQYHAQKFTPADLALSKELLGKAVEMDNNNANAYTYLAGVYYVEFVENWTMDRQASLAQAKLSISRALNLEPDNAIVHGFMSEYFLLSGEHERAEFHADKSMELNPTLPDGYAYKSWALTITGRSKEALEYAKMCFQLDPHHPYAPWMVGEAYRESGDFDQAIKVFRSLPHIPASVHGQIAMCLAGLGEIEQAKTEMQYYQELAIEQMPNYPTSIEAWRAYWSDAYTYKDEQDLDKTFNLLLKAGLGDYVKDHDDEIPSIAVLPFENMSGDPEQEYFSDGITSDIIATLSRFRNMRVVARHSTLVYKERKASIDEISKEQDVRYILEGNIRKSGNKVRVNTELIDSFTGENCWSESFDRNLDDIFAVQDEITMSIATAMKAHLTDGDRARSNLDNTCNINAWKNVIVAEELSDSYIRENLIEGKRLAAAALKLSPDYAAAWAILGWIHWQQAYAGWSDSIAKSLEEAEIAANRALEIDPEYWSAWSLKGFIRVMTGEPDLAIEATLKSVAIAPGNSDALGMAAFALAYAGEYEKARPYSDSALRLCPIHPNWMLLVAGAIFQDSGLLQKAIDTYRRSVEIEPNSPICRFYLMDALIEAGKEDEANRLAREINALDTGMKVEGLVRTFHHDKNERNRFRENLAKMGFHE